MRLFMADGGMTGFALKGDDVVSVFNHDPDNKGAASSMLLLATQLGGRRLDAFDTVLPSIYAEAGFKAVARLPFNDEYQPDGWDRQTYARFNQGRPDVVFMAHDPESYAPYRAGEGAIVTDYDEAVALQQAAVAAPKDILLSTSRPMFYSQLEQAIQGVPDRLATMAAPQWKLWLDANAGKLGVKKDEVDWSGVKDYLDTRGKDKVTRDELVQYMQANGVKVGETVLGGNSQDMCAKRLGAMSRNELAVHFEEEMNADPVQEFGQTWTPVQLRNELLQILLDAMSGTDGDDAAADKILALVSAANATNDSADTTAASVAPVAATVSFSRATAYEVDIAAAQAASCMSAWLKALSRPGKGRRIPSTGRSL